MRHHPRKFVTNFPGVPPLSARARLSFAVGCVSTEPYFVEAAAIPHSVSDSRKYFSKPFRIFRAETGSNLTLSKQSRAQICSRDGFVSSVASNRIYDPVSVRRRNCIRLDVRFVPHADILIYSITSSARASSVSGTVRPSALAVLRFMASSNVVGCSTGRSPGFTPFRILSTKCAARRVSFSHSTP